MCSLVFYDVNQVQMNYRILVLARYHGCNVLLCCSVNLTQPSLTFASRLIFSDTGTHVCKGAFTQDTKVESGDIL